MAILTGTFSVRGETVFIVNIAGDNHEYNIDKSTNNAPSAIARAVVNEFRESGTTSGTITVTAVP